MMLSPFTLTSRSPAGPREKTVSPQLRGELVAPGCPHGHSQQDLNTARAAPCPVGQRELWGPQSQPHPRGPQCCSEHPRLGDKRAEPPQRQGEAKGKRNASEEQHEHESAWQGAEHREHRTNRPQPPPAPRPCQSGPACPRSPVRSPAWCAGPSSRTFFTKMVSTGSRRLRGGPAPRGQSVRGLPARPGPSHGKKHTLPLVVTPLPPKPTGSSAAALGTAPLSGQPPSPHPGCSHILSQEQKPSGAAGKRRVGEPGGGGTVAEGWGIPQGPLGARSVSPSPGGHWVPCLATAACSPRALSPRQRADPFRHLHIRSRHCPPPGGERDCVPVPRHPTLG